MKEGLEMKKLEVYRSFEGKLDADNQSGYIIYDGGDWWQIEIISVGQYTPKTICRIDKNALNPAEFEDFFKIAYIETNIEVGNYNNKNMQVYYRNKWYISSRIREIQNCYQDYNWKKYV